MFNEKQTDRKKKNKKINAPIEQYARKSRRFSFCLNVKWLPNNNNNRNLPTFIPFRHYLQPTILLLRKEEERDWIHGHALTHFTQQRTKKKNEKIFPLSSLNLFVPFKFFSLFLFLLILILLSFFLFPSFFSSFLLFLEFPIFTNIIIIIIIDFSTPQKFNTCHTSFNCSLLLLLIIIFL